VRIARVFPRRTKATPCDELAFVGMPPMLFPPHVDKVHVSVTFTWDIPLAKVLAKEWEQVAPVEIGGPAMGTVGDDFTPGMYLKPGMVITSRGCPVCCDHCLAWRRDGNRARELPIRDGWNVLDDNLLRCSDAHVRAVFDMLERQNHRPLFTGGLEAKALKDWHIERLAKLLPEGMFFAYDDAADWEPLVNAGKRLLANGFKRKHPLQCYVLIGQEGDTFEAAEKRLRDTWDAGFLPMAMLFQGPGEKKSVDERWRSFQNVWANKWRTLSKLKGPSHDPR